MDFQKNLEFAKAAADLVSSIGEIPINFAVTCITKGWLDEFSDEDRELGMKIDLMLLETCDIVRVFLPPGSKVSSGMEAEIECSIGERAIYIGISSEYFNLEDYL